VQRSAVLHRLLAVADVAAGAVAGLAAGLLVGIPPADALALGAMCAIVLPGLAVICGLYAAGDLRTWASGVPDIERLVFAAIALSWPLYAAAGMLEVQGPSSVAIVAALMALALMLAGRAGARALVHRAEHLRERTAIVGSGMVAAQMVRNLRRRRELGLVPVGIVDDAVHHHGDINDLDGLAHFGAIDELSDILRRHAVDRVIIAFTRGSHQQLLQGIRACRDNNVPVHVVPRLFEFLDGARALDHVGGLPILSLGVPGLNRVSRAAKRGLDIAVSGLLVVVLSPLLLAIAVAIKVESRGPVLFRQPREGRGKTTFDLLKFRSMHAGADERKPELLHDSDVRDGVMFKMHQDPRVTRVGRLLRRFSLDELPQLWHVLRGQMSLVGPRPLILSETQRLVEEWHLRRHDLRPGMTGPWQIYGRSDIPFQDMVRFDYQYVAGWSLARDIEILLATVPAVLSGRGAY
jgi:exopolysaccharide biosynthesis polyprenyl glycosylphosphotransferase